MFYFDFDLFIKKDTDKKRISKIEEEIIKNICPSEEKYLNTLLKRNVPQTTFKPNYGAEQDSYVVAENDRVEFVFQKTEGGLYALYIGMERQHIALKK